LYLFNIMQKRIKNKKNKNQTVVERGKPPGTVYFSKNWVLPLKSFMCYPESVTVVLSYNQGSKTYVPATNFAAWSLGLNTCFDIDPLLGGGTMVGFTNWSAIYRHYLALKAFIELTIINNDDQEVGFAMAPTDLNFSGLITSSALATEVGELPYAKIRSLAAKGGQDRCRITQEIDLGDFIGNPTKLRYDDLYSSLVNTIPGNPLYQLFVAYAIGAFTKGITTEIKLSIQTKFWGRSPTFV